MPHTPLPSLRLSDRAFVRGREGAAERLLFQLDTNKDGTVTEGEFCRGFKHWRHVVQMTFKAQEDAQQAAQQAGGD